MKKINIELSFENLRSKKLFVLSKRDLLKITNYIFQSLKGSKEYLSTKVIVGAPRLIACHVCDDKQMRKLQKMFRNLDRATDVLSFCERDTSTSEKKGFLGTIVLSVDTVARHARSYNTSLKTETLSVYVHSVLHLIGFDHVKVSSNKRARMRAVEKQLKKELSILLSKLQR